MKLMSADLQLRYLETSQPFTRAKDGTRRIVIAAEGMGVDLSRLDVTTRYMNNPVVLFAHDHTRPIGRTVRGPFFEDGRWIAEFEFADGDPDAERVCLLYDQGVINAASIGFFEEVNEEGETYPLLVEWSLVAIGMDKSALALRSLNEVLDELETEMNNEQDSFGVADQDSYGVADQELDDQESDDQESNDQELDDQDSEEFSEDDSAEDQERDFTEVIDKTFVVISVDELECIKKAAVDEAVDHAVARALLRERLVTRAGHLLPKNMDTENASIRELLVSAVGDEIQDVESRSDDYLHGVLDSILDRRSKSAEVCVTMTNVARPRNIRDIARMNKEI